MTSYLKEIAEYWKLEAKQENSKRYFFDVDEAKKIIGGNYFYVIGRKGSGKSAISEYVVNISSHDTFSEKLSFKNFPFNELYSFENQSYTPPNQYITIWKYIIYSNICRLMVKNENIASEARNVLEKLYPPDPIKSLARLIDKWTTKEFGASILGTGGTIKIDNQLSQFPNLSWIEKTNILEDIIEEYIDDAKYYIVFDELDEDYRIFEDHKDMQQYIYLITSLFKAVQDIKNVFGDKKSNICPIIFLRDDIYSLIKDADKNKWSDFKIELEWDKNKIKRLLAHRISRAIKEDGKILHFTDAWRIIFSDLPVQMGDRQQKPMHIFDYISLSTHFRPRDYIKYIQVCAERTVNDGYDKIHPKTVKTMDKGFSNYMKDEIIDEIHTVLPEIDTIFSIISQIRKWNFSINEFKTTYSEYLRNGTIKEKNIDFVLQTLFNFSVIGNRPGKRTVSFFKYENKEARFNFSENIVVHRGLFKALQIL